MNAPWFTAVQSNRFFLSPPPPFLRAVTAAAAEEEKAFWWLRSMAWECERRRRVSASFAEQKQQARGGIHRHLRKTSFRRNNFSHARDIQISMVKKLHQGIFESLTRVERMQRFFWRESSSSSSCSPSSTTSCRLALVTGGGGGGGGGGASVCVCASLLLLLLVCVPFGGGGGEGASLFLGRWKRH